jgi:hypothetical protein
MAGKYTPLGNYLRNLSSSQKEVTLPFEQVERIISDKLPASAYRYHAWWSNEKDPHQPEKQAIANAGWKVETVSFSQKWVRLVRI